VPVAISGNARRRYSRWYKNSGQTPAYNSSERRCAPSRQLRGAYRGSSADWSRAHLGASVKMSIRARFRGWPKLSRSRVQKKSPQPKADTKGEAKPAVTSVDVWSRIFSLTALLMSLFTFALQFVAHDAVSYNIAQGTLARRLRASAGCPSVSFGFRPMRCPRFVARLRPSAVRVRIRSRSTSARPSRTAIISRPVLVLVSALGSANDPHWTWR